MFVYFIEINEIYLKMAHSLKISDWRVFGASSLNLIERLGRIRKSCILSSRTYDPLTDICLYSLSTKAIPITSLVFWVA